MIILNLIRDFIRKNIFGLVKKSDAEGIGVIENVLERTWKVRFTCKKCVGRQQIGIIMWILWQGMDRKIYGELRVKKIKNMVAEREKSEWEARKVIKDVFESTWKSILLVKKRLNSVEKRFLF